MKLNSTTLTHLYLVDSSTITLLTGLLPTAGCLVSFYYDYVSKEIPEFKQTV